MSWTSIADAVINTPKAITQTLMYNIRDNLNYLKSLLETHNHDGGTSALIEMGPNALRNGSFETDTTGWTMANYTGGSNAVQTSGASHGKKCWAATSTVLANGGASAISGEFVSVSAGDVVNVAAKLHASVANISAKVQIIWYNSADAQVSTSDAISYTNTPTSATLVYGAAVAPATARSYKINLIGGVPATGSATGTVYFDGVFARGGLGLPYGAGTLYLPVPRIASGEVGGGMLESATGAWVEAFNARILVGGTYRTAWDQRTNNAGAPSYAKVYKNGSAFGTQRNSTSTTYAAATTEDLEFKAGDTVQLFLSSYSGAYTGGVSIFRLGTTAMNVMPAIPYLMPMVIGER